MIKRLQKRFILISVLSVLTVLILIMGIINISIYRNLIREADSTIAFIAQNGGTFPKNDFRKNGGNKETGDAAPVAGTTAGQNEGQPNENLDIHPPMNGNKGDMSAEAPFETRFFVVNMNASGRVSSVNTGSIAAITTKQAAEYARTIYSSGQTSGFIGDYRYGVSGILRGKMIVFLDCGRGFNYFRNFLKTSLVVSVLALLGVFVLVTVFSKRAIQPIAESYEKQKHFITDAGHELKTPLTVISANTEVLEMTQGENEWTHSIRNQIARLTELTNNLVSLARMDEQDTQLLMTDFSLSDAVSEALEPFYSVAAHKGRSIESNIQGGLTYCGNEDAIRKLVGILADNAVKYSGEGGKISVSLRSSGRGLLLQTENTIEGNLPKGAHDELFERFYRGDASHSSQVSGYGVGLSMARAIAAAHKGRIAATSEDGKTLTVTVTL